jgi:hypothetical protein
MTSNPPEHDKSYVLEGTSSSHLTQCMRPEPLGSHQMVVRVWPNFGFWLKADSAAKAETNQTQKATCTNPNRGDRNNLAYRKTYVGGGTLKRANRESGSRCITRGLATSGHRIMYLSRRDLGCGVSRLVLGFHKCETK